MAISKRDKIRGVTWLDNNSKDLIKISFMKSTENIVTNISAEDDFWVKKVKKDFTLDQIDKMTGDYHKYQADREILFDEFYDNYQEWARWKKNKELQVQMGLSNEKGVPVVTSLSTILSIANNKEAFFKMKLDIFELDQIKNHKDRKLKSALRKSKTMPELLGLLYQAAPDLESEPSEPHNKIPVQDVTNQEDNEHSNQSPIDAASDVPIESSSDSE